MGSRAGLGRCGRYRPRQDLILGPSSPYRVAILTVLSWLISTVEVRKMFVTSGCGFKHVLKIIVHNFPPYR